MNNSLAYGTSPTVTYDKLYDTDSVGIRRSVARGISLPDTLKISQISIVNSATKVPATRTTLRIERAQVDANLNQVGPSATVNFDIPQNCPQADIDKLIELWRGMTADVTNNPITLALAGQK